MYDAILLQPTQPTLVIMFQLLKRIDVNMMED
jgi:hypothetical protein